MITLLPTFGNGSSGDQHARVYCTFTSCVTSRHGRNVAMWYKIEGALCSLTTPANFPKHTRHVT